MRKAAGPAEGFACEGGQIASSTGSFREAAATPRVPRNHVPHERVILDVGDLSHYAGEAAGAPSWEHPYALEAKP